MKILIDFDYFWVRENFYPSKNNIFYQFSAVKSFFEKQFSDETIEYRTIISEPAFYQSTKEELEIINPVLITNDEVRKIFNDNYIVSSEVVRAFYDGNLETEQLEKFKMLYKTKLEGFEPDLILSFELHDKVFDYVFPDTFQLSFVGGIFKRGLGPATYLFDPLGFIKYSSLNHFKEEINNFPITTEQENTVNEFKNKINLLVKNANPMKEKIEEYRKKFDYLVLLPLQFNGHYGFDTESDFRTQYDFLDYVMKNVPSNVGVIVTEHDHGRFLEEGLVQKGGFLSWFENKYKNFIYIKELKEPGLFSSSLFLLADVDAIINISSSVALTGLLFDKKIISLAKSANDCYKDSQGLENILEVLNKPIRNKNSLIYWFLTHYCFFDKQITDNDFMYNYLIKSTNKFKTEGIKFNYFEKMNDIKEICDYTLDFISSAVKNYLESKKTHRVIRICGIKFSFRLKHCRK